MNVRKSATCVMLLLVAMIGFPVAAEDASKGVGVSTGPACKTNQCDEICLLTDKTFEAISCNRDYSAIGQFISKVDVLTGGGRTINERAYEAFLDLLKRLSDFHSDSHETRMCAYEAQKRLVSRMLPLGGEARLSKRMRRMMAERLKWFLDRLDDRIIPGFKPKPVYINVAPPIVASTNNFIGFNQDAVLDPQVRHLWGKAIEENHTNAMLNKEQIELSRMKTRYGAYVIEAIKDLSKDERKGTSFEKKDKH